MGARPIARCTVRAHDDIRPGSGFRDSRVQGHMFCHIRYRAIQVLRDSAEEAIVEMCQAACTSGA